eukprot:gb/GECG01010867.1/.p1 GENE.gb/GECG01010867.1/~~gb/GECG01010867.1/.p1  ORF type:complete len:136 (+),score=7.09 gb/GECG01010867.1/:1-408(+)
MYSSQSVVTDSWLCACVPRKPVGWFAKTTADIHAFGTLLRLRCFKLYAKRKRDRERVHPTLLYSCFARLCVRLYTRRKRQLFGGVFPSNSIQYTPCIRLSTGGEEEEGRKTTPLLLALRSVPVLSFEQTTPAAGG